MAKSNSVVIWGGYGVMLLLLMGCANKKLDSFTQAVRGAGKLALYEGLPHQSFEADLLERERKTKPVRELHGYPFYQETLALSKEDAHRLSEILGDANTYLPFSGEKKCGGFHPDYAVEWQVGSDVYRALICFGCREAKLFGPAIELRVDLSPVAYKQLRELLKGYHKNRPASKILEGSP